MPVYAFNPINEVRRAEQHRHPEQPRRDMRALAPPDNDEEETIAPDSPIPNQRELELERELDKQRHYAAFTADPGEDNLARDPDHPSSVTGE